MPPVRGSGIAFGPIDPDNNQPVPGVCPPDHLRCIPVRQIHLGAIRIGEGLVDPSARCLAPDGPRRCAFAWRHPGRPRRVVHPKSIYTLMGSETEATAGIAPAIEGVCRAAEAWFRRRR